VGGCVWRSRQEQRTPMTDSCPGRIAAERTLYTSRARPALPLPGMQWNEAVEGRAGKRSSWYDAVPRTPDVAPPWRLRWWGRWSEAQDGPPHPIATVSGTVVVAGFSAR